MSPLRPADALWGFDAGRAVGRDEGYSRGHRIGFDAGYRVGRAHERSEGEAEAAAARDLTCKTVAAGATSWVPADELADRRGEHDRADQLRAIFVDRGLRSSELESPKPTRLFIDSAMVERCLASWDAAATSAA